MARVGRGTVVDADAAQLLQDLPDDLLERGWAVVVTDSRVIQSADGPRYRVVYSRPFDDRLDTEAIQSAAYDPRTRQHVVRVSTLKDCSPSWHDAHQDAIQRMREADARRRRRR